MEIEEAPTSLKIIEGFDKSCSLSLPCAQGTQEPLLASQLAQKQKKLFEGQDEAQINLVRTYRAHLIELRSNVLKKHEKRLASEIIKRIQMKYAADMEQFVNFIFLHMERQQHGSKFCENLKTNCSQLARDHNRTWKNSKRSEKGQRGDSSLPREIIVLYNSGAAQISEMLSCIENSVRDRLDKIAQKEDQGEKYQTDLHFLFIFQQLFDLPSNEMHDICSFIAEELRSLEVQLYFILPTSQQRCKLNFTSPVLYCERVQAASSAQHFQDIALGAIRDTNLPLLAAHVYRELLTAFESYLVTLEETCERLVSLYAQHLQYCTQTELALFQSVCAGDQRQVDKIASNSTARNLLHTYFDARILINDTLAALQQVYGDVISKHCYVRDIDKKLLSIFTFSRTVSTHTSETPEKFLFTLPLECGENDKAIQIAKEVAEMLLGFRHQIFLNASAQLTHEFSEEEEEQDQKTRRPAVRSKKNTREQLVNEIRGRAEYDKKAILETQMRRLVKEAIYNTIDALPPALIVGLVRPREHLRLLRKLTNPDLLQSITDHFAKDKDSVQGRMFAALREHPNREIELEELYAQCGAAQSNQIGKEQQPFLYFLQTMKLLGVIEEANSKRGLRNVLKKNVFAKTHYNYSNLGAFSILE